MTSTWTWCPLLGASPAYKLRVDTSPLGDGYTHRAVRGINPVGVAYALAFPFASLAQLDAMLDFLKANAASGFNMDDPTVPGGGLVFVTVDDWACTLQDKASGEVVGVLTLTFNRAYNPQPGIAP